MKKFKVKFVREFEVDVDAETSDVAQLLAKQIVSQFPADTCRLLSIIDWEYVEQQCEGCLHGPLKAPDGKPPGGPPNLGGSPQTPALPVAAPLVDQIAEAA